MFPQSVPVPLRMQTVGAVAIVFMVFVCLGFGVMIPLSRNEGWESSLVCTVFMSAALVGIGALIRRRRRQLVAALDADGVLLRSGRKLAWSELQRIDYRMSENINRKWVARIDLHFSNEQAFIGTIAVNWKQVNELLRQVPVEQRETSFLR